MPIRPLSKELQEIAEKELNEVPSRVQADLDHIREWISQQPHLKARTDDQWLIAFLRGSKFSLEQTKHKIDAFYTMRSLYNLNRDPFSPEIQEALRRGILFPLPKTNDPTGPRIFLKRFVIKDTEKIKLMTYLEVGLMLIEILLLEDDNFVVAGIFAMMDYQNFPYSYISQLNPDFLSKVVSYSKVYPARVKGLDFFNASSAISVGYNLLKVLCAEKFRSRIFLHTDDNIKDLHNIPISILPKDYGGDEASCDELAAYWKAKIESYREWFLEDVKYGVDESKRLGKSQTEDVAFGTEGSFRKIQLD